MKRGGATNGLALAAMILFIVVAASRAQQPPIGHASDFATDLYFEPPNDDKVEMKLSGTEAQPLPDGLLDVKNLKIEKFETNGVLQVTALAPQCTIALLEARADSAGHLKLISGDEKFRTEGDGFLLLFAQGKEGVKSLTISNRVHTVIEGTELLKP
jgi:hypothetical protein